MSPPTDIISAIDALIDDQLEAGEPEVGYSHGDPTYPKCWHCSRHEHFLPITERIAQMYAWGQFDYDYVAAEDDTPMVCEGSDFIGPRRPTEHERLQQSWGTRDTSWSVIIGDDTRRIPGVNETIFAAIQFFGDRIPTLPPLDTSSWLSTITWPSPFLPEPVEAPRVWRCQPDKPVIEFGPQNWHHELGRQLQMARPTGYTTYTPPRPGAPWLRLWTNPLTAAITNLWTDFTAPDFPIPESPGYDFTAYNNTVPWPQHRLDGRKRA